MVPRRARRAGIIPRVNALRLPVAAAALIALYVAAAALGACSNGPLLSDCLIPTLGEVDADGGPDPCHCNPAPSLNITTCPCLSGGHPDKDAYLACMATYREEMMDAGASTDGGPIPGCTGQCWPPPPAYWTTPLLLWIGPENDAPSCPTEAPFVFYDGYAGGSFALACTSGASGTCPMLPTRGRPSTARSGDGRIAWAQRASKNAAP
jgi:hypothetical protein